MLVLHLLSITYTNPDFFRGPTHLPHWLYQDFWGLGFEQKVECACAERYLGRIQYEFNFD